MRTNLRALQILFSLLLFSQFALASTINKTLYINRGVFTTVSGTTFPFLAFNSSPVYNSLNPVLKITTSDVLILKIINNDTAVHGFDVKNYSGVAHTIAAADSVTDTLTFSAQGIFIYYDNYQFPKNEYLGLGGMVCVNNSITDKKFYWNIKEHETTYNTALSGGGAVNWNNYYPDYFTINGLSHPDLQNDSTARVLGNVGDTIHIFMVNTGHSIHSIHFHGFHLKVLYSSSNNMVVNSSKDTFPLKPMEGVVLEMVPDKVGDYSVHDHNLVAITGGNTHPNGMFIIMKIQ